MNISNQEPLNTFINLVLKVWLLEDLTTVLCHNVSDTTIGQTFLILEVLMLNTCFSHCRVESMSDVCCIPVKSVFDLI